VSAPGRTRVLAAIVGGAVAAGLALRLAPDPLMARATALAAAALILWITEAVPPYVVTLGLLAGIPLALGGLAPRFQLAPVLQGAADPVLALFFGGFALGAAASRHGLDRLLAEHVLVHARHRRRRLLALVVATTALLSMWMSNVAAAAMMFGALEPHVRRGAHHEDFRRALLLGVAVAANLGGMATPIGTGPNAIAIARFEAGGGLGFGPWMAFALPLTIAMLAAATLAIVHLHRVGGSYPPVEIPPTPVAGRQTSLLVLFGLAVAAWLTEPLHGVPAPNVALIVAGVLFAGGWLGRDDLHRIDWPTLLLIAGGLVMGRLIEGSGILDAVASGISWPHLSAGARVTGLVLAAALMSAVMSNTASAAILVPLAASIDPDRSLAILIAIGASFGMPFAISTPANAMAHGRGLRSSDLLRIGWPLMLFGTLLVALTGPAFLRWCGIR
jgi:sodium-dependent dicarboxylate transporter 2/3/5